MNKIKLLLLVLNGLNYKNAKYYLKNKNKLNTKAKNLLKAMPFNYLTDKLFSDFLSAKLSLCEYEKRFPECLALYMKENNEKVFYSLSNEHKSFLESEDIIDLIKLKKHIIVKNCDILDKDFLYYISYQNNSFCINNDYADLEKVKALFSALSNNSIIVDANLIKNNLSENNNKILHIVLVKNNDHVTVKLINQNIRINSNGIDYGSFELMMPNDDSRISEAVTFAKAVSDKFSEVEYFNFSVFLTDNGFSVFKIDTGYDLLYTDYGLNEIKEFVNSKIKNSIHKNIIKIINNYSFSSYAKSKGFLDYMYRNWRRGVKEDNALNITTKKQKKWAHKRGYYSYRIKQYNLTEDNYKTYLSDYDYKRLRPLNNYYRKWFSNKLVSYFVLSQFSDLLPEYYFRIITDNGKQEIISFSNEYDSNINALVELLKVKGKLVMKPSVGSHGEGFFKLEYNKNAFSINGAHKTESELISFFCSLSDNYIISEYIEMHSELKKIYDKVACTVRVMAINKKGNENLIQHAYFRIGTGKTGNTDNLSSGGIASKVNIETGEFYDSELLVNHEFVSCDYHPETNGSLNGILPNWDLVKASIPKICKVINPIEYLGFDVVITDNGFKILEINMHQDLHKYPEYPDYVKQYFSIKNKRYRK